MEPTANSATVLPQATGFDGLFVVFLSILAPWGPLLEAWGSFVGQGSNFEGFLKYPAPKSSPFLALFFILFARFFLALILYRFCIGFKCPELRFLL